MDSCVKGNAPLAAAAASAASTVPCSGQPVRCNRGKWLTTEAALNSASADLWNDAAAPAPRTFLPCSSFHVPACSTSAAISFPPAAHPHPPPPPHPTPLPPPRTFLSCSSFHVPARSTNAAISFPPAAYPHPPPPPHHTHLPVLLLLPRPRPQHQRRALLLLHPHHQSRRHALVRVVRGVDLTELFQLLLDIAHHLVHQRALEPKLAGEPAQGAGWW